MDQDPTPPPPAPQPRTTSNPSAATLGPLAASSSAARSPVRGPTSSAMLRGMSSSPAHSSRRRSSPSSGRLAAGASGSGSSSGSPSSSRFRQQIPPQSPRPARGGRQRTTQALPSPTSSSPVLSELASIRSVGAARATSQQRSEMRAVTLYGGRPLHQALLSWSAMYARSRRGTPPPSGTFSGVAPPPSTSTLTPHQTSRYFSFPGFATSASQQAQPSSSGAPPPRGGIPSPAMQQQQAQPSSSVVRSAAGGILSGGIPSPAMPQQQQAKSSFTDLAPLPGGSGGFFPGFAPPASQQPEAMPSYSDLAATQPAFHGGQGQPLQQAWPSSGSTMSRIGAPPPTGGFSGFAPPASQQLQPSSSGVPQLPGGTFSGYPSPAMGQPQANSSFTDLSPQPSGDEIFSDLPSGSGIFSDLPSGSGIAPAASQQLQAKTSFTTLAPMPNASFFGLTPGHGETAMFGCSSWPSPSVQLAAPPPAANYTTMYGHGGQASSSESELPPLPPTLQIRSEEVMQFSQPARNDDSTFGSESEAARTQRPPVVQVKKEPVDIDDTQTQCLHEPQLITVDDNDDEDAEITALLDSFRSPNEPGSLGLEHTSTEDVLQKHGGSGVGSSSSSSSAVEGSGQSWKAMLTPPYDNVTTGGSSIPWNCSDGSTMSMSQQQQMPQQGDLLFSTIGVSDVVAPQYCQCQPSEINIMLSGFEQLQLQSSNLQMPTTMLSATDLLHLISGAGTSIWSAADTSGSQGAAAGMPAASAADMFGQMNIGGGTMSVGQGWPETALAANQYGMFDNSGSSSSAWAAAAVPDQMASKFDQMNIGDQGTLSIGQGWPPATPAPTFDITGGSSSAWANMPWNSSSWAMENYSTPGPELGLGAMEQPRLTTTPRSPSVAAGASRSVAQRGGANGDIFSLAEIEMIIKDKRLKEMVNTDPKRVKKILNNRTSVSKLRPQRRAE